MLDPIQTGSRGLYCVADRKKKSSDVDFFVPDRSHVANWQNQRLAENFSTVFLVLLWAERTLSRGVAPRLSCFPFIFASLLFFGPLEFTYSPQYLKLLSCLSEILSLSPLNSGETEEKRKDAGSLFCASLAAHNDEPSCVFSVPLWWAWLQLWRSPIVSRTSTCRCSVKMQSRGAARRRTPSAGRSTRVEGVSHETIMHTHVRKLFLYIFREGFIGGGGQWSYVRVNNPLSLTAEC